VEADWLMIAVLALPTAFGIYIGRVWFRRWFNPFSLYSGLWGFCLCNYEIRLIQYQPISFLAWTYITLAWVSLYVGAALVFFMKSSRAWGVVSFDVDLRRLRKWLIILSAIGAIGVLDQVLVLRREFGGLFEAILINANDLYSSRMYNEISSVPYVGSFAFAACSLAGVYTAKLGRITPEALIPLVVVSLHNILGMGRLWLGFAAILFLTCYFYTPRVSRLSVSKWQKMLAISLVVAILLGGFLFVSSVRVLGVDFPGITPAMERVTEFIPIFPSLYSYFSAAPVAFSVYLDTPDESSNRHWGRYTFAPAFRVLSKFGFQTSVPAYEENYYTPVPMNTDTYLKNVHSDFGLFGILFFPLVLGAFTAHLILRAETRPSLPVLVALANVNLVMVFAFFFDVMLLGDWYISTIAGVGVATLISQRSVMKNSIKLSRGRPRFEAS